MPFEVLVSTARIGDAVEPDVQIQDYRTGDLYLLCTDGVTDMVDDNIIAATLEECGDRLTQTAERLIDHALNGGGKDNITVVLLQVVEVAEESRARHSARSTLTMDTDDMPVVHDELEDTSPGFALNPADPSDAETLTEVEVRQSTVVRKQHAQTQEVPYRPWQQTELNAPPKPGVPLPFRREMARQVQISNDMPVDVVAPTEPSRLGLGLSRSLAPATRDSDDLPVDTAAATEPHGSPLPAFAHDQPRRAALATTAKHPVVRDSQPLPDLDRALRSAPLVSAPSLVVGAGPGGQPADEHAVTTDLAAARAQAAKPVLRVRVDGMPYKSGGTEAEMIAPVVVEDTERVDSQARAAEVAEARRSAETAIAPESSEKAQLRITAVGKPNPRKLSTPEPLATQVEAAPTVNLVISGSIPKIYVASTPPPRPDRLTTMNSQAVPEGLPLDDDEDEA